MDSLTAFKGFLLIRVELEKGVSLPVSDNDSDETCPCLVPVFVIFLVLSCFALMEFVSKETKHIFPSGNSPLPERVWGTPSPPHTFIFLLSTLR
ncbi:hypothetical protein A6R68_04738 [Neotoma lepida]|uniref:Uncharacterized protein n=1 Tax=Neotoma lepida TaxID=56216 RepID=A0A1A6GN09_NEOLE|nr:hypothetical protein A6R68_04738 [Neotoma lepida]